MKTLSGRISGERRVRSRRIYSEEHTLGERVRYQRYLLCGGWEAVRNQRGKAYLEER